MILMIHEHVLDEHRHDVGVVERSVAAPLLAQGLPQRARAIHAASLGRVEPDRPTWPAASGPACPDRIRVPRSVHPEPRKAILVPERDNHSLTKQTPDLSVASRLADRMLAERAARPSAVAVGGRTLIVGPSGYRTIGEAVTESGEASPRAH